MNKKKILIISIAVIIIAVVLYVFAGTMSIRGKMNRYLTDKGHTASVVKSVKVKHSFLNILLSYDEWNIDVKYYDEPETIYHYKYKGDVIVFSGISGGTKDKDQYKYAEKEFRGTIIEVYSNGNFVVEPNENEEIRKSADKISVTVNSDKVWEVGMKVFVTYTGEVMETYPAQINTIDVQRIIYEGVDYE